MTRDHHGSLDVETYSEAGYVWDEASAKWQALPGARDKGLRAVGAAVYASHPTTDILTLSYRLPGGPVRRWNPSMAPPGDLFAYLAAGGVLESHNAMFERLIWFYVLHVKYGWPALPPYQQRCSMATANVNQFPAALGNLSEVLRLPTPKDARGKKLLDKFSVPRNPTKKDARRRVLPAWMAGADPADAEDFEALCAYCDTDVIAEDQASERMDPMTADELTFWWVDQEINWRGMGVDRVGIRDCIAVLRQALDKYGAEARTLTGGLEATQLEAIRGWMAAQGVHTPSLDSDHVDALLQRDGLPPAVRRVLEVRQLTGSASVKKLFAMENQATANDRLVNLLTHHGARTGRPTGEGPQPLNLPKAGPKLRACAACKRPFAPHHVACPWCAAPAADAGKPAWKPEMVEPVLEIMGRRDLALVEWFFGDAVLCISGCIRGLFVAAPGHELIASDYSSIEAVVIAMLAGEQWRIDAFREGKPIYLLSASKITGTPLEAYEAYAAANGDHHPDRQSIGKVAELGLGFGGWVNAWLAFDDSGRFSEDEIKQHILAWRRESPAIVEFWGGQFRGRPWDRDRRQEYYGVEGHAVLALLYPGQVFHYRGLQFYTREVATGTALKIRLPSGRELTYHKAALSPSPRDPAAYAITYWTWNSNPKYGAMGWVPMSTFGGRLVENIVQAVAHDIQRFGILGLRAAGYHTILHVYDENVCEVPTGAGSIEQFERIMSTMPPWAHDWPIRAAGGWRGRRYRKG